jgi:Uma2 family endonuclease
MPALQHEQPGLLTAEQFYAAYAHREGRYDLVDGKVIAMPPAGPIHGKLDSSLSLALGTHIRARSMGHHLLNVGFILRRDPDLVRAADQAFVSREKAAAAPPPREGFWEVAPDLAVEIVSPDDTPAELAAKLNDYLSAGVRMVWVINPRRRTIAVHRPGEAVRLLQGGEGVLDGEDVLPGVSYSLEELWREGLFDSPAPGEG